MGVAAGRHAAMTVGFAVAVAAVPFFDLLDREVAEVATAVFGDELTARDQGAAARDPAQRAEAVGALVPQAQSRALVGIMEASRLRLAQGVDSFVRSLPAAVRNDSGAARAAAYALVGLADEKMLHYPAGGLEAWRERLLEVELYGSALAGQEVIRLARESAQGVGEAGQTGSSALLAPLYLALLREGFEGSLRADALGLTTLTTVLEETVGAVHAPTADVAPDRGPARVGLPPAPLAVSGFALWLIGGLMFWLALAGDDLVEAERMAARIESDLPVSTGIDGKVRTLGPSALPPESDGARDPPPSRGAGRR